MTDCLTYFCGRQKAQPSFSRSRVSRYTQSKIQSLSLEFFACHLKQREHVNTHASFYVYTLYIVMTCCCWVVCSCGSELLAAETRVTRGIKSGCEVDSITFLIMRSGNEEMTFSASATFIDQLKVTRETFPGCSMEISSALIHCFFLSFFFSFFLTLCP